MIISRTPLRVSLFGGGTDYPAYYREHGGETLGFAIDKYSWVTLRKLPQFFSHKHRICWSEIELVNEYDKIKHPVIREILKLHGTGCGIETHYDGDLPARSGLGSSSSFTVGFLNAIHAFKGARVTRSELAQSAIHVERDILRDNVGSQDQVWAAYGGFNHIQFRTDGSFSVDPVIIPEIRKRELQRSVMLFFTGFSRNASEVAGDQIANFPAKQQNLRLMRGMVMEALAILHSANLPLSEIGKLLHDAWRLKRDLAPRVSTARVDEIYEAGRDAGAVGGKLLGAGGGGFMLFFVPASRQTAVRERLKDLVEVSFEIGAEGSKIVLYQPEGL